MNVSRVMARFLPLMDLSIILLGMFLIVLSIARFNEYKSKSPVLTSEITNKRDTQADLKTEILKQTLNTMEFLPVYGCCKSENGRLDGRCYRFDPSLTVSKEEISMDTDEGIRKIIEENKFSKENIIICLITGKGEWDAAWDAETIKKLELTWNCGRIYRVINFENLKFEE